ncbi:MAG: C40 family peptidase [Anaerolineae bacterium]|nr:C40 family peptidase [Gemmatimonadaceae bacterium]
MSKQTLVITSAIAPLMAEARAASEQVSQRLYGQTVEMLELRSPWHRVRGMDGYEGWLHLGFARALSAKEQRTRYALNRVSLGCTVRDRDAGVMVLPLGCIIADDAHVEHGLAIAQLDLPEKFPRSADAVAQSAVDFFRSTSYEWGGVTPWGADCSGLVQTCLGLHGIPLPRDARQQALEGLDAGRDMKQALAGDLLFFSDRSNTVINHVAIALGGQRLVHLALGRGGYRVESLDSVDDPYVKALTERFQFVRRVI